LRQNVVEQDNPKPRVRIPVDGPISPAPEIAPNDPTVGNPAARATVGIRRVNDKVSIVDLRGGLTIFAENTVMEAFPRASTGRTGAVILNFSGLEHMNSSGIGLLITLLIRANRREEQILSFGVSEHCRRIFELARLHEAFDIYDSEAEALDAVNA
jgi:anti-sigma B factor antagonist